MVSGDGLLQRQGELLRNGRVEGGIFRAQRLDANSRNLLRQDTALIEKYC